jgi:hypothetical protein
MGIQQEQSLLLQYVDQNSRVQFLEASGKVEI